MWNAQGSCSGVELRAKDTTAQLLQGFTESVTVTYSRGGEEWACPVGVRNAKEDYGGRKLSGGMVLFWGSPTLPLIFPLTSPGQSEPHCSYLKASLLLPDPVVAE